MTKKHTQREKKFLRKISFVRTTYRGKREYTFSNSVQNGLCKSAPAHWTRRAFVASMLNETGRIVSQIERILSDNSAWSAAGVEHQSIFVCHSVKFQRNSKLVIARLLNSWLFSIKLFSVCFRPKIWAREEGGTRRVKFSNRSNYTSMRAPSLIRKRIHKQSVS